MRAEGRAIVTEYLSTSEAAKLVGIAPNTLRNKMYSGEFQRGVHFTKPRGLRLRWIRAALEAYLRGDDGPEAATTSERIPLAGVTHGGR